MKRLLIPIVMFVVLSCDDKPKKDIVCECDIKFDRVVENVKSVTYNWTWANGPRTVEEKEHIVGVTYTYDIDPDNIVLSGDATVYDNIVNKTCIISDVFTYKKDNKNNVVPDLDSCKRAWVIKYSNGNAKRVKVNWSGWVEQKWEEDLEEKDRIGKDAPITIETVFQIYTYIHKPEEVNEEKFKEYKKDISADTTMIGYGIWPSYSNNIRPQIEIDTLFWDLGLTDEDINHLRDKARSNMIARYYSSEKYGDDEERKWFIESNNFGKEFEFPTLPPIEGDTPLVPNATYYMQLFTRIFSKDSNANAYYEITDGVLTVEFLY